MAKKVPKPQSRKAKALADLFAAAKRGDVAGIEESLRDGANPLGHGKSRRTPLMEADRHGRLAAVRALLPHGGALLIDVRDWTALSLAAAYGRRACVKELMPHGGNKAPERNWRWAALTCAAHSGHLKTTKLLMARENLLSRTGRSAMRMVEHGRTEKNARACEALVMGIVDQLQAGLAAKAKARLSRSGRHWRGELLRCSAEEGFPEAASRLMEMGADPHERNFRSEMSAFMMACVNDNLACAKAMLKDHSAIDDVNKYGYSALSMSVAQGHVEMARWLVAMGAHEGGRVAKDRWTLLIYAAKFGRELVELCMPLCDPKAKNIHGMSALMMAASHGDLESCKLLAPVSDIGAKDEEGCSALGNAKTREVAEWLSGAMRAAREAKSLAAASKRLSRARARPARAARL